MITKIMKDEGDLNPEFEDMLLYVCETIEHCIKNITETQSQIHDNSEETGSLILSDIECIGRP